jgi:hypothetical protein
MGMTSTTRSPRSIAPMSSGHRRTAKKARTDAVSRPTTSVAGRRTNWLSPATWSLCA